MLKQQFFKKTQLIYFNADLIDTEEILFVTKLQVLIFKRKPHIFKEIFSIPLIHWIDVDTVDQKRQKRF